MTLERIRIKSLLLARAFDKSKVFEITAGAWLLSICFDMGSWFMELDLPTSNQKLVVLQSIGLILGAGSMILRGRRNGR